MDETPDVTPVHCREGSEGLNQLRRELENEIPASMEFYCEDDDTEFTLYIRMVKPNPPQYMLIAEVPKGPLSDDVLAGARSKLAKVKESLSKGSGPAPSVPGDRDDEPPPFVA